MVGIEFAICVQAAREDPWVDTVGRTDVGKIVEEAGS